MKSKTHTPRPPESRVTPGAHDRDLTVAATRNRGRTRVGKIARLPNEVRQELNQRLQDGEPGESLLDWLNALPKVRKVLAAQFTGRPITKQNLSEWKLGGYRDWEQAEEDRLRMERLTERAAQWAAADNENPLSQQLAAVLLVELAATLDRLRDESLPLAERWRLLRQMLQQVAQMRREDHRAGQLRIEEERREWEERLGFEHRKAKQKELTAPYDAAMEPPVVAEDHEDHGGSEMVRQVAAHLPGIKRPEIKHEPKPGTLGATSGRRRPKPADPVKPGPAKSPRQGRQQRRLTARAKTPSAIVAAVCDRRELRPNVHLVRRSQSAATVFERAAKGKTPSKGPGRPDKAPGKASQTESNTDQSSQAAPTNETQKNAGGFVHLSKSSGVDGGGS